MEIQMKRKLSWKWVLMGIIFALTLGIGVFATIYNMPQNRIQRQLELGQRYLEEGDYEAAIVAFDEVISIDEKQPQAYIGKAAAYVAMEDYENAVEVIEDGYEQIPDPELEEKRTEICKEAVEFYYARSEYEMTEQFLEKVPEAEQDDKYDRISQELQTRNHLAEISELLAEISKFLATTDYEQAKLLAESPEYIQLTESLEPGESYYYGEYDENDDRNGIGTAVYPVVRYDSVNIRIYYYGNWQGGKRSGNGLAIAFMDSGIDTYGIYSGEWLNDLPNGEGEERYNIVNSEPEEGLGRITCFAGYFQNGLYNGEMHMEITWPDRVEHYRGMAESGNWMPVENDNSSRQYNGWICEDENGGTWLESETGETNQGVEWLLPERERSENNGRMVKEQNIRTMEYSLEELVQMAIAYRRRHNLYMNQYIDVDHIDGDMVTIHCYDFIVDGGNGEGHTATSDWYTIDKYTAIGYDLMGDEINLNE